MLTVTDSAKQYLKELLLDHTDDPEIGLRLSLKSPEQLGLVLEREAEGDQVVEHAGSKVLLVSQELASLLEGATVDVQDTADGPKLVVSREKQD